MLTTGTGKIRMDMKELSEEKSVTISFWSTVSERSRTP